MALNLVASKRGFTLIELLVTIAIIAVLVALLLPAVQQAREAARQSQCRNNLKQIGISLHNYHDTYGAFPQGYVDGDRLGNGTVQDNGWSWHTRLLPFLDQSNLYDKFDLNYVPFGGASIPQNHETVATPLTIFTCPTDTKPEITSLPEIHANSVGYTDRIATSSYVGALGAFLQNLCKSSSSREPNPDQNGFFTANVCRQSRDITDGLSNTIAVGEATWELSQNQVLYGAVMHQGGAHCHAVDVGGSYYLPAWRLMRTSRYKLNGYNPDRSHTGFHSMHHGGAHFLFADGSVRFVSENIHDTASNLGSSPATWGIYQKIADIDDGAVIGEF